MKLIIQIPCFNEGQTLAQVFRNMPRSIPGVEIIEYQIIDDGSTDNTAEVARALGVHHIVTVRGENRRWLGRAFRLGIDNAIRLGADIVVNTDGDNQYPSTSIPDLVRPIIEGRAEVVIGNRNPGQVKEYSFIKRILQRVGSGTIQILTGERVPDAVSGFRAYSRAALDRINIITDYTYTIDSLMQVLNKGIAIEWIPITPNKRTRESRLISSLADNVRRLAGTILRLFTVYRPLRVFSIFSLIFFIPAALLLGRYSYIYFFLPDEGARHVQSVIVGGVCLVISVQLFVLGILGELLSVNRNLIEDLLARVRRIECPPTHQQGSDSTIDAGPNVARKIGNLWHN